MKDIRGVTLIALIVTIIVLLILAGILINLIFDQEKLLKKANEAVTVWNTSVVEEKELIKQLMEQINSLDKVEATDNVILAKSPTSWTSGDVTVVLNYENIPTGYAIQYKVGTGSWTTGTSIKVTANNTTVYGRLYNTNLQDEIATNSVTVSNIDKVNPTAPTGITKTRNENSVVVKATGGTDSLSGVKGYQYSIDNKTWTSTIASGTTHTFSGITQWQSATIYARTIDNVNRVSNPYTLIVKSLVANPPNLDGFDKENTYYVSWDLTNSPYQIKEDTNLNKTAPSDWYDYTEGVNQWANIKTTGGGNDCYWVWIPRYAYKVPTRSNTAESIEIAFLKEEGTSVSDVIDEDKRAEIQAAGGFKTTNTPGNWVIHPAFTNTGTVNNGGFGELTGIWVAKFEASNNSTSQVIVKPNATTWSNISVGNIFTVCKNLTLTGNSLANTTNIDSHMMKNTEWGAVAYLSRSIYGKNSAIWNNPYYDNTTGYKTITGLCGSSQNTKETDLNNVYKYNEIYGGNASTTGNVYGIYDMAGGSWEYVTGILSSYKSKSTYYNFSNQNQYPNKYFDWYVGSSSNRDSNYNANAAKYGDAIYETTYRKCK